jgi:hypothetical protein
MGFLTRRDTKNAAGRFRIHKKRIEPIRITIVAFWLSPNRLTPPEPLLNIFLTNIVHYLLESYGKIVDLRISVSVFYLIATDLLRAETVTTRHAPFALVIFLTVPTTERT